MADDEGSTGAPEGLTDLTNASAWRRVWLKAIAQAWHHDGFRKDLIASPRETLQKTFGYTVPAGIEIKVVPVETDGEFGWNLAGKKGWTLPSTVVTVPLPPKPEHVKDHAVALSDLLGHGKGFCADTCCF
jgi:ribosomally synthesized peptide (two-chain TOMM family)